LKWNSPPQDAYWPEMVSKHEWTKDLMNLIGVRYKRDLSRDVEAQMMVSTGIGEKTTSLETKRLIQELQNEENMKLTLVEYR
jgi:hypothetical protein